MYRYIPAFLVAIHILRYNVGMGKIYQRFLLIVSSNLLPVSRRHTVASAKLADNEMRYWSTNEMFA